MNPIQFQGHLMVRTTTGKKPLEKRVQENLAKASHLAEERGLLLTDKDRRKIVWRTMEMLPAGQLKTIVANIKQRLNPNKLELTIHPGSHAATIDYGNSNKARKALHEAIILENGADLIDTKGDILKEEEVDVAIAKHLRMRGPRIEEQVAQKLWQQGIRVATAESCTGGLISSRLTDVDGSSSYTHSNVVTYSEWDKKGLLGVKQKTLDKNTVYSHQVAQEMAEGLRLETGANIAVSITGLSGSNPTQTTPGPGGEALPNGTAFIGLSSRYLPTITKRVTVDPELSRDRKKYLFSEYALTFLRDYIDGTLEPDNNF